MADLDDEPGRSKWAADDLVARADVYDRAVGIVSGFQYLYTEQSTLAATVAHFERYPTIVHPDGHDATPDFTVLFHDGGVLIGEVAQLPLAEQGVDALCRQIQRYDNLPYVQGPGRETVAPGWIDHLLIVPHGTGTAAVNRLIRDRLEQADHWFTMTTPPCIVSAAGSDTGYVFERQGSERNGTMRELGRDGIGAWLIEGDISLKAHYFEQVKAQWVFMNDEIDPLYLATHLWTREFPTMQAAPSDGEPQRPPAIRTTSGDLATTMRKKYGKCRSADINKAMSLLERGRFARRVTSNEWEIAWGPFQHEGDDVRRALAQRAETPPREGNLGRLDRVRRAHAREVDPPPTLWDALAEQAEQVRAASVVKPSKPRTRTPTKPTAKAGKVAKAPSKKSKKPAAEPTKAAAKKRPKNERRKRPT